MSPVNQEALLLAISDREDIFEMFDEMFSSENYHNVLMAYRPGMTNQEIAQELDIVPRTVTRAFNELEEYGLITSDENGQRQHSLPVLTHPIIQYYYWKEEGKEDE